MTIQELGNELIRFGFWEGPNDDREDTSNVPSDFGTTFGTTTPLIVFITPGVCADNLHGPISNEEMLHTYEELRSIGQVNSLEINKVVKEYHNKRKENEQRILDFLFNDRFHCQPRKFQVLRRCSQPTIVPTRPHSFFRRVSHRHRVNMPHG